MNLASVLVSSVLPTPVGPRNMNEPIGRFGSFNPARARRTARLIAMMASSCPIMPLRSSSSILSKRVIQLRQVASAAHPSTWRRLQQYLPPKLPGWWRDPSRYADARFAHLIQSRALPIPSHLRHCFLPGRANGSGGLGAIDQTNPWTLSQRRSCTYARVTKTRQSSQWLYREGIFQLHILKINARRLQALHQRLQDDDVLHMQSEYP